MTTVDYFAPPALCRCGFIFRSAAKVAAGCSNITFIGCRQDCPRCGGPAQILDGSYDVVAGPNGVVAHVRALQPAQVQRLAGILALAERPADIAQAAESEADPKLRMILQRIVNSQWTLMVVKEVVITVLRSLGLGLG